MGVSKQTRTYASRYKTDVSVSQTTNTGFDSTTRILCSGDGADSAMSASDDVFSVQPVNDDTTGAMLVKNQGGSNILAVDTTNSKVLVGASQVAANTQYVHFSVLSHTPAAGRHYPMGLGLANFATAGLTEDVILGTGTDPATTLDISETASESVSWAQCYLYLPDAIVLDSAIVLSGGSSASDSALNFHIMSYTLDTSTNHGDLSSGLVVADSSATSGIDEDVIKTTSLTIQSANIAANKVLLATYESDSANVTSSRMIVKYHIQ